MYLKNLEVINSHLDWNSEHKYVTTDQNNHEKLRELIKQNEDDFQICLNSVHVTDENLNQIKKLISDFEEKIVGINKVKEKYAQNHYEIINKKPVSLWTRIFSSDARLSHEIHKGMCLLYPSLFEFYSLLESRVRCLIDALSKNISAYERAIQEKRNALQDLEEEEEAKARGKAKGLAMLYETQIQLLLKYKKDGLDIEKEVFSMREKLLVLEKQENSAMVQELMQTLDSI